MFDEFCKIVESSDQNVFIDYFKKHVFPDIKNIARYSVEQITGKYFNQFTGVTTNHGEG